MSGGQFKIPKEKLCALFVGDNIKDGKSLELYKEFQGKDGLLDDLILEEKKGINSTTVKQRQRTYGTNAPPKIKVKSLMELILEQFEDKILRILLLAATVSLAIGIWKDGIKHGWLEGVTIYIAVIIIVSVSAGNNYFKDRQFRTLMEQRGKRNVSVLRDGKVENISIFDLVVGDILYINQGDMMPVDCILISGSNVRADESSQTGEPDEIPKNALASLNDQENVNPFLISGSQIKDGKGEAVVCAVGENTQLGKIREKLIEEPEPTPLQKKLERISNSIGKLGMYSAILTFFAMIANMVIKNGFEFSEYNNVATLAELLDFFIIAITIIVVAVPEGLPLAVTISLAYSVGKMKDENNLVRQLQSCETMGGSNNVCSDKTGTLTQNKMTVVASYIEGKELTQNLSNMPITNNTVRLFYENSCFNSTAFVLQDDATGKENRCGSATECALLILCREMGFDYSTIRNKDREVFAIPFSSRRKRMSTIIKNAERPDSLTVYTKGASEIVLDKCTWMIGENGNIVNLPKDKKEEIINNIILKFAGQAYRTVCMAYKEIPANSFNPKLYETPERQDSLEEELTMICIVGIQDPVRIDVPRAVKQCHEAGIIVRMVTGDNLNTARAIAKNCGILTEEDDNNRFSCIEGKFFREYVGGLKDVIKKDPDSDKTRMAKKVVYQNKFDEIASQLRVMARSSPEDKYILVTGLKEGDKNVIAVTGDGTNDAPALKKADVGFAMGIAGTEVAKEAADIILLDDNFSSIVTAAKWGRNIYQGIRKFLQFQLTVNVVAIFMAFIGGCVLRESPLNSVQMLWVNLIMDTFASLALATEPPSDDLLKDKPYSKTESLITPAMWRNIFCQGLYQIGILTVMLFSIQIIPPFKAVTIKEPGDDWNEENGKHYTLIFHTFVFMQVFNEINSRKIKEHEINVFANFFNNPLFLFIIIFTIGIQCLLVEFGGVYVKCTKLDWEEHAICIGIGAFSIIFGYIAKKIIPASIFNWVKINEKEMTPDEKWNSVLRYVKSQQLARTRRTLSQKKLAAGVQKIIEMRNRGKMAELAKKLGKPKVQ